MSENSKRNLKFTVVIRTFNRPNFLKQAINSVLNQRYLNWEILIFDDGAKAETFEIYSDLKIHNPDKRILYISSGEAKYLFRKSWFYMADFSEGDILVMLDDDDALHPDALSYLNQIYQDHENLDFTIGSCAKFNENLEVYEIANVPSIKELPKTKEAWIPYTIENGHPWGDPWMFKEDFYEEPQEYTSIIHASKANLMAVYALYTVKKNSLLEVKDLFNIVPSCLQDLYFFGCLEYLGLSYTNLKKALIFVRDHRYGRITDATNIIKEGTRIKDIVDHYRPNNFKSSVFLLDKKYTDWESIESLKNNLEKAIAEKSKKPIIKSWLDSDKLFLSSSESLGEIKIIIESGDKIIYWNTINLSDPGVPYWFCPDNKLSQHDEISMHIYKNDSIVHFRDFDKTL